jgi:methylglutaconyl-CoA hydratase
MDDLLQSIDSRGVATLTLNRPNRHNAFDDALIAHMTLVLRDLERRQDVRLVVLTGSGPSFCAGADIEWMRRVARASLEANEADAIALFELLRTLDSLSKPTIALVHGDAYGGGVGLVACCDIAIASDRASFCFSEVKLGVIPAVVCPFIIRAIGVRQARRFFMTAETIFAESALAIGLVHRVVPENVLGSDRDALIEALLQGAPGAQAEAKSLIGLCETHPLSEKLMRETARRLAARRASSEGQEGLAAFLEKRSPAWRANGKRGDV